MSGASSTNELPASGPTVPTPTATAILISAASADSIRESQNLYTLGLVAYKKGDEASLQLARDYWTRSADLGLDVAQYNVGVVYRDGDGGPRDYKLAAKYFELCAERNDVEAQFELSQLVAHGESVISEEKAVRYLTAAAESGHPEALYWLGINTFNGTLGITKNRERGVELFQRAAACGNSSAEVFLGLAYRDGGCGLSQSLEKSVEYFNRAATQNNRDALFNIGNAHAVGNMGYVKSSELAAQFYTKASQLGQVNAITCLANAYEFGLGVEQSYQRAAELFQLAIDRGDGGLSHGRLGGLYSRGLGVTRSIQRAIDLWTSGSHLNDALSQFHLADQLMRGEGVTKNNVRMLELLHASAAGGNRDGQNALAICYRQGLCGCEQNYSKALEWFKHAANDDPATPHEYALTALGEMYEKGLGVAVSVEESKRYYQRAAQLKERIRLPTSPVAQTVPATSVPAPRLVGIESNPGPPGSPLGLVTPTVSVDGRWDEPSRLRVTEELVGELQTLPPIRQRCEHHGRKNPFFLLLWDRERRTHLLPHLILDYPLRDEFLNCVLSQLVGSTEPGNKENVAECAPLLIRNLQMYGYDFQKIEMATTVLPSPPSDSSTSVTHAGPTPISNSVVPVQTIFLLPFIPSTVAVALVSLPTTPLELLERNAILTLTSTASLEKPEMIQALLRKGCDPNSAPPQIGTMGLPDRDSYGRVRLSQPLVASITVESPYHLQPRLLSWLILVAQYGHLENLNLVERSYHISSLPGGGVIQFDQSALDVIQSQADQHPQLTLVQANLLVIKKIIAWQRHQLRSSQNHHNTEFESIPHLTSSSTTSSASSSASSSTLVPIPYLHHRLSDLLNNSADVTDANFRIHDWLSHAWSRMPELLCLTPPSDAYKPEFLPSALARYPNHLYLGERYTAVNDAQPTVFGIYLSQFSYNIEHASKLEPYADVLIRQLQLLTPHELLTHPKPNSNSPTGFADLGTPLMVIPLPKKEGDVMWRVWDLLLTKHEEGTPYDSKLKLGFSQKEMDQLRPNDSQSSTDGTNSHPTLDQLSVGPRCPIFVRLTEGHPPPSQAALLSKLFQLHHLDYDILGSTVSMYLIHPFMYEYPIKLDLIRYWAEHGLLDFVSRSRPPPLGDGSRPDRTILEQAQLMVKEAEAHLESSSPTDKWRALLAVQARKEILDILTKTQART